MSIRKVFMRYGMAVTANKRVSRFPAHVQEKGNFASGGAKDFTHSQYIPGS